ncbi:MAG: hypothetical protein RID91_09255 [Azospirillaceae bacterium]
MSTSNPERRRLLKLMLGIGYAFPMIASFRLANDETSYLFDASGTKKAAKKKVGKKKGKGPFKKGVGKKKTVTKKK